MRSKRYTLLPIFFILIINLLAAAGRFEFSPLARSAYDKTLALRFDEANGLLAQLRQKEPDNLIVYYIENYMDCLRVFISEEKTEFDRLKYNENKRLSALQKGDSKSPYYLFTQAQVRLLWAMNRAKFGEYLSAFEATSTAFEQLEQNQKKFPSFMPNKMSLGVLHAIVGTIPSNYKWGVKLLSGMNGTVQQGQAEIEEVIRYAKTNDFVFEQEALVMYAFLMLHLNNNNESAWNIVNNGKLKPKENLLASFALANVAMRTGHNDKAVEILQNRPTGNAYFSFHYLDYLLGLAKMYRGDADADVYIKKFINNFRGKNYVKEAYQRLAWHELLRGNWSGYQNNIAQCKWKGNADVGGDKNALKEAQTGAAPEANLLRSRLYFDGGYYQKAYDHLHYKKESDFGTQAQKLEFTYRMGRILQMLRKTNEAIAFYDQTIRNGRNTKYYFACNAALQMGIMYEEAKMTAKAREYYNYCLNLNPDDHADALHAKAKAGLSRLSGKK